MVLHVEFALILQLEDCSRSKLVGKVADAKGCTKSVTLPVREAGHVVALSARIRLSCSKNRSVDDWETSFFSIV